MEKLLEMLEQDCTLSPEQLAAALGKDVDEVNSAIAAYEKDRTILGYKAIVDWDRIRKDYVTALIEVNVTPQSIAGFDRIAERIYQYDEVETVYLMSGGYDFAVILNGKTLREVSQFVSDKLSTLDSVLSTSTHFVLKKYKEHGTILAQKHKDERMLMTL